ncbi:MAG: UvrD-helicase domain-containing protein [Alphaproteobacteria bacterium]|nr:UvrD-helicase domain-containing protein [Alphaproteobacteria bacterium]
MGLNIGDTVYHHEYGMGKIVKKSYLYTHVNFKAHGIKRMLEMYLEPVSYNEVEKLIPELTNLKDLNCYISNFYLEKILDKYNSTFISKGYLTKEAIQSVIKKYNEEFTQNEVKKYPDVFNIENELNEEQKYAVTSDEISGLVIAGAGCGKTTMLISKIAYLLKKGISPDEILVLSYTNRTVDEMKTRLEHFTTVKPTTIHAFCKNEILKNKCRVQPDLLDKVIKKIRKQETGILKIILEYLGLYNDINDDFDKFAKSFNSKKSIVQYENNWHYTTLQSVLGNVIEKFEKNNQTLKGNKVKSLAEAKIANFLFLNDIDYEYEAKYPYEYYAEVEEENKAYYPDFCLHTNVGDIWIEHFGITIDENKNRSASWCKDEKKYIQQMDDKIKTHEHNHTTLIQTNQTLLKNGKLLTYLEEELKKHGVAFNPLSEKKIEKYVSKLLKWKKYNTFETFIERYINLFKSQDKFTLTELEKHLLEKYSYEKDRTKKFFSIVTKIYKAYQNELKSNGVDDFADMIMKAIDKLKKGEYVPKYKYIIVDEFQDVTRCTYNLIHLLQEKSGAKLFCVGDDWQSIYGFAGSDVSLFESFEELFPHANSSFRLIQTHRNSQQLLDITKAFIEKNPRQIRKELKSKIPAQYPIKVANFYKNKIDMDDIKGCPTATHALEIIINDIYEVDKNTTNITILGRYSEDINSIIDDSNHFTKGDYENGSMPITYKNGDINMKINFMTIHKAKGLEFDNVVLFLREGEKIWSFPSGFTDDYLLEPLLHKTDHFPNAEERRIFYVALTRCKRQCYIINSEENTSSFYQEIKDKCYSLNDTLEKYCKRTGRDICPACGSGIYEEHTSNSNKNYKFWACDNLNCTAKTSQKGMGKCPECGGMLVERTNKKNENFLGCQNYRQCTYTESLINDTQKN